MTANKGREARRYLRFRPDPTEVAFVDSTHDSRTFNKEFAALIVDVAPKGGCSLVIVSDKNRKRLGVGDRCRVQVGDLRPLLAEVVWAREIDSDVYRCGFMFLE